MYFPYIFTAYVLVLIRVFAEKFGWVRFAVVLLSCIKPIPTHEKLLGVGKKKVAQNGTFK